MCVARLNVSVQPCAHRWYDLRKACQPSNNLSNCPEKLQLQGWENRSSTCPWCDDDKPALCDTTHRLVGVSTVSSSASSTVSSPTTSEAPRTGLSRSGSEGTLNPLSMMGSLDSVETDLSRKHRDMNDRLELYLRLMPHEILPSAKKNYPSYSASPSQNASAEDLGMSELPLIRRSSSGLSKQWKKSVRLSRGIFRS